MNSTPSSFSAGANSIVCSAVQPQLASTRNSASVCFRSSRTMPRSSAVPSLILYTGQPGISFILATIFSGVSMPSV